MAINFHRRRTHLCKPTRLVLLVGFLLVVNINLICYLLIASSLPSGESSPPPPGAKFLSALQRVQQTPVLVLRGRKAVGSPAHDPPKKPPKKARGGDNSEGGASADQKMHDLNDDVTTPFTCESLYMYPKCKPVPSDLAARISKSKHYKTMTEIEKHIAANKKLWSKTSKVYPVTAIMTPDRCPAHLNHLHRNKRRLQQWHSQSYEDKTGVWQSVLNDKIGQTFFVHHINQANPEKKQLLTFPRVYGCNDRGPQFLTDWEPPSVALKTGYVVKDMGGYSSHGVYVLPDGFGGKELLSGRILSRAAVIKGLTKWKATKIIIEEYIPSLKGSRATVDYKFLMFGEKPSHIFVIYDRGRSNECFAAHAMDWSRVDAFGCFASDEKKIPTSGIVLCNDVPKPKLLPRLIEAAKLYGKYMGIFYRVDLFIHPFTKNIVLGEFTPWPCSAQWSCHATFDSERGYDACALGREWATETTVGLKKGYVGPPVFEGGPGAPVPDWLKEFKTMSFRQRCARVREYSEMYE